MLQDAGERSEVVHLCYDAAPANRKEKKVLGPAEAVALQRGSRRVPEARGTGIPSAAATTHERRQACMRLSAGRRWRRTDGNCRCVSAEEDRGCLDGCCWKNRETSSALAVPVPLTYKYLAFLPLLLNAAEQTQCMLPYILNHMRDNNPRLRRPCVHARAKAEDP